MTGIRRASPHRQGGAVTLAVTAALLLLISAAALYANRSFVVEARTATSQVHHMQAFEAAQAGVEHMLAKLVHNNVTPIASTTLSVNNGQSYLVSVTSRPSKALLIDSLGCADGCDPCSGSCPVKARITQLAAWVSVLPNVPTATLTARASARIAGKAELFNTDSRHGGTTVRAGGTITTDGEALVYTVPGSPASASLVPNDSVLSTLRSSDMFQSMFGMDRDTLRAQSTLISATGPACGSALNGQRLKLFWVDGDCIINATDVVGTAAEPVLLVVTGNLRINGTGTVYGMVYNGSTDAVNDLATTGRASVIGAAVTEGDAMVTGKVDLVYDRSVLRMLRDSLGTYGRLPGTWKDFQ